MKSNKILSLIITLFVSTSIFAASSSIGNTQIQKNGEIIAILMTVDKNEIALANEALKKQTTPAIKKYAQMLKTQHTENLNKALKLSKKTGIAPIETKKVILLQHDGAKGLATLSPLKDKAFDRAYINAMVSGHTAVLKMIDDDLLKNASNSSVKAFVLATRPHIEYHLKQGQIIQKSEAHF